MLRLDLEKLHVESFTPQESVHGRSLALEAESDSCSEQVLCSWLCPQRSYPASEC